MIGVPGIHERRHCCLQTEWRTWRSLYDRIKGLAAVGKIVQVQTQTLPHATQWTRCSRHDPELLPNLLVGSTGIIAYSLDPSRTATESEQTPVFEDVIRQPATELVCQIYVLQAGARFSKKEFIPSTASADLACSAMTLPVQATASS